jgi:hypothetical protein
MKKHFELTEIGLEDLALVGGGCRKRRCEPPSCNPCDPWKKKENDLTMTTAPSSADLATIAGDTSGAIGVNITICDFGSDDDCFKIDVKGILPGGCYGSDTSDLPDIGAVPGAPDSDSDIASTSSLPGVDPSSKSAPMDAELATALPGV